MWEKLMSRGSGLAVMWLIVLALSLVKNAAAASLCDVEYILDAQWNNGFTARALIHNRTDQVIDGWSLNWTMPDGQRVTHLWNGSYQQNGADTTVTNLSYNARINPGASTQFGFNGSHNGTNRIPGLFLLNGISCGEDVNDDGSEPISVSFAEPADNAIVSTEFAVKMNVTGLTVEPAGEVHHGTGHLHILVDTDFIPAGQPIPKNAQHLHYGNGQVETVLQLEPGAHTLRLQFADGHHIALAGDEYRDEINLVVEKPGQCKIDYFIDHQWNNGFTGRVRVNNLSAREINGWRVDWAMLNGQRVQHLWNGVYSQNAAAVSVDNAHYNARIPSGGSVEFGFNASHNGVNDIPGAFRLNGVFCEGQDEPEPEPVSIRFVEPLDGATLAGSFNVTMEATGVTIEPAGEVHDGAGHLHILVDTDFIPAGQPIPSTAQHIHYGQGQLQATLQLDPGPHTLRLQFANGHHIALAGDQYRDQISVTVSQPDDDDNPGDDNPPDDEPMPTGEELYISKNCVNCHGSDGQGVGSFPALTREFPGRDWLIEKINNDMPLGSAADCQGDCANLIADYILVNFATTNEPPPLTCTDEVPGPRLLRLLTRREYDNTTQDLLGVTTPLSANLPVETRVLGYDNNADVNVVTARHIDAYLAAAEDLATQALVSNRNQLLPCDPNANADACARQFVGEFGLRAYRRPLTQDENDRLSGLFAVANDFDEGVKLAISAILISPNFLYRSELGEATANGNGYYQLTPYEVASSLSYLFWGTLPDQALLNAAAAGQLQTTQQLAAQAQRLLADPRARRQIGLFSGQWLGADPVTAGEKDPATYPDYTQAVQEAADAELAEFVNHVIFSGSGRFDELFNADYVFVNDTLADFYGMSGVNSDQLQMTPMLDDSRGGVLSLASVLAAHAHSDDSSPIKRGVFVRKRLLCHELPPPPPTVDNTPPPLDPTLTTRERFAAHSSSEFCQVCHQYIDGVGFGFEAYNGAGAFRSNENGQPVDDSGNLLGLEEFDPGDLQAALDDIGFFGLRELSDIIATSEAGPYCLTTQYFRYSRGYQETAADQCAIDNMYQRFVDSDYDLKTLLTSIVTSPNFILRRDSVQEAQ